MENIKKPFLNISRLVIETISPMAIYSGGRELGFDNQLARDANDLPYIPASTIAGVWRHVVEGKYGKEVANDWFGTNDEKAILKNHGKAQHASILQISNGEIHNGANKPISGLIGEEQKSDDLLKHLLKSNPVKRERVRINTYGTAVDKSKFDQVLLPTGVRFTIDIRWGNSQDINEEGYKEQWIDILSCWFHTNFAFGSSTRNGLGQFKLINHYSEFINLSYGKKMADTLIKFNSKKKNPKLIELNKEKSITQLFSIKLKAVSGWRCGHSTNPLNPNKSTRDKLPDAMTYSEFVINWSNDKGVDKGIVSGKPVPLVCGSSIKGMLAHRIAFHLNRFEGNWAEDPSAISLFNGEQCSKDLDVLFGTKSDGKTSQGQAGLLLMPDCKVVYNHENIIHRTHNAINRFTGGALATALFDEELLQQPTFTIVGYLLPCQNKVLSPNLKKALLETLSDIETGRLSIGTNTGRGTSLTKAEELTYNKGLLDAKGTGEEK